MGVLHSAICHPRRSQLLEALALKGPSLTMKCARLWARTERDGEFQVVEDIAGVVTWGSAGTSKRIVVTRAKAPDCGSPLIGNFRPSCPGYHKWGNKPLKRCRSMASHGTAGGKCLEQGERDRVLLWCLWKLNSSCSRRGDVAS